MRERGGAWVGAQFVLMALVAVAAVVAPGWPEGAATALRALGGILVVLGVVVVGWAMRALGRALTPFPEPLADAALVEHGPFAHVRHPIYAGALLVFAGIGLASGPVALGLTGGLALLWIGKIDVEERRLRRRFPGYAAYAERVPRRIVPGVF